MGCFFSTHNRIQIQQTFTCDESASLKQTWNLLKTHDIGKFADDILIRTITRNSLFRQYWISRLNVDGNNYDFSQGESCLRTDRNWFIGIREYSIQLLIFFDQLLSVVPNESLLLTYIRLFRSIQNILIFEHNSLIIMKQCILEVLGERFQMLQFEFTVDYQRVWSKFLSFVIQRLLDNPVQMRVPTQIIVSPATINDPTSINRLNSRN